MASSELAEQRESRTAGEAGWHESRYNLFAPVPGTKHVAIANLFKGTCAEYTPIELYALSAVETLDEDHPLIERFARRGVICNFDERAALEAMGRAACAKPGGVGLAIHPTMGCNFDCPYCFEDHGRGKMGAQVQDDVVALAQRMLDASGAKSMRVTWSGGEPLMAPDVVESLSGRLMGLCAERGVEYTARIVTNGYLLTQDVVDMLAAAKVERAQITIDGIGAAHDATRHLVGGGPTFGRITSNLRGLEIPFGVDVRHNVHEGNRGEMDAVAALVDELARESGNDLKYYPAVVKAREAAEARGEQVGVFCGSDATEMGVRVEAGLFHAGRGYYCTAHGLWEAAIDDEGNLKKCWEAVDKPQYSFGTARDWDPADPLATASAPDNLTRYLNTAEPVPDDECRECVWRPLCVGGCPHRRLFHGRECIAFKDDPEAYVLAVHAMIGNRVKRQDDQASLA